MSQSRDGRLDAGSNTEPHGETIIDIDGNVSQTHPQTYEQQWVAAPLESHAKERYAIYKAANKGDWETAKRIYETNKLPFNAPITSEGQTALHIAALAGQTQFARELINKMRNDDWLWQQDSGGNIPIVLAMVSGDMELAEAMLHNCESLSIIKIEKLWRASLALTSLGRKDIVRYMYGVCKDLVKNDDRAYLLVALINADIYDTAWDLATGEWFAACRAAYKVDALSALAEKPHLVTSNTVQKNNLHRSAYELAEYICDQVASDDEIISNMGWVARRTIFVAARHGNVEFLKLLIKKLPDLVFQINDDGKTIFHVAVLFRRAEVFELLGEIRSFKYLIAQCRDERGNNLLHLAGELSTSDYLDAVPGEALQLQTELLWFERVKKSVGPFLAEEKNNSGYTPDDVFMKNHRNLIEKGKEWTKKTAESCTIVAAIVATVVFAAVFTAPGGNNKNSGFPIFLKSQEASFKVFIVSDSILLLARSLLC